MTLSGTESSFTSLWQSILNTEVSRAFFMSLGREVDDNLKACTMWMKVYNCVFHSKDIYKDEGG